VIVAELLMAAWTEQNTLIFQQKTQHVLVFAVLVKVIRKLEGVREEILAEKKISQLYEDLTVLTSALQQV
jgi:DNA-directed RNA polymerase delta subunit